MWWLQANLSFVQILPFKGTQSVLQNGQKQPKTMSSPTTVICGTSYTCRATAPHSSSFALKQCLVVWEYEMLKLLIVTVEKYKVWWGMGLSLWGYLGVWKCKREMMRSILLKASEVHFLESLRPKWGFIFKSAPCILESKCSQKLLWLRLIHHLGTSEEHTFSNRTKTPVAARYLSLSVRRVRLLAC